MTALRQRMIEDMQLRGLTVKTQQVYIHTVKQLAEHYDKSPDRISEEELRQYFLHLKNVRQVSPSTFTVALYGIKFLYQQTLRRDWTTLELARPMREKKLPVVLSRAEVRRVLACIHRPHYRVCLSTIYACGLRVREGVYLQVQDIDSDRKQVHVRHAKGSKARYVPLPTSTLRMLRQYWTTHRHPVWLFPSPNGADKPMSVSGVQRFVGGQVGMVGVLHTWGRNLSYHPHVHYLIPAVGMAAFYSVVYCPSCGRVMQRRRIARPKGRCPP